MPRFRIVFRSTTYYDTVIEAQDIDEAYEIATNTDGSGLELEMCFRDEYELDRVDELGTKLEG